MLGIVGGAQGRGCLGRHAHAGQTDAAAQLGLPAYLFERGLSERKINRVMQPLLRQGSHREDAIDG